MGGGLPDGVLPIFDFKEMHAGFAVCCMGDPLPESVSEENRVSHRRTPFSDIPGHFRTTGP
jgi:hypothetical protein